MHMCYTSGLITTEEDHNWAKHDANSLNIIMSTVSSPEMPLEQYLMLLRVNGHFIRIGVLEDTLPPFGAFSPTAKGVKMGGSAIGSPKEIEQMLKLAAKKRIRIWN